MNRFFKFFALLFLCLCVFNGVAQERSIKHTVSSGETITSIAKKYMVTAYDLQQANPDIVNGVQVNDVITIPQSKTKSADAKSISDTISTSIANTPLEYTVVRGDTKFSLARRFGLTIKGLESRYPQIVPTLLEGQILSVPNEGNSGYDNNLKTYVVTKLDTKFGLAKKFNVSIPELERVNPHIAQMLQVGQTIKIPATKGKDTKKEETPKIKTNTSNSYTEKNTIEKEPTPEIKDPVVIKKDPLEKSSENKIQSLSPAVETSEDTSSKYTNLSATLNTSKQKQLLFFLPFSESEYNTYNPNESFDKVSDEFRKSHLEFYKGASIAIDSIRKLKLNLKVDILEVKDEIQKSEINTLAASKKISSYDAVILPYYNAIDEALAAILSDSKTPVITASHSAHQNPSSNLYSAMPSANIQRKKILDYMRSTNGNIIVISDVNREESKLFISEHAPNAAIINLEKNGTYNNDELIGKFKKDQINYVIIDSERNSVFINTTNILLSELSKYTIQIAILESHMIPDKSDVSVKRYQILKMMFPSLVPAQTSASTNNFTAAYLKKYNMLPSENVLSGFDITMDTILRLAQEQSFQNSAENQVTEYTQLKFDYKKNAKQGYSNQGIYLLHYDTGSEIKEIN